MPTGTLNASRTEHLLALMKKGDDAFNGRDFAAVDAVLYGHRSNIETDLRSLKRTVRLHQIAVKTVDMLDKELYMAISAYNLVGAVICLAARRANLSPRQLSSSFVLDVVNAAWPRLLAAKSREQHHAEFDRLLDFAASYKLPKRKKRRSYPRALSGGAELFSQIEKFGRRPDDLSQKTE